MKYITKHKIAYGDSYEVEEQCNNLSEEGFVQTGNLCMVTTEEGVRFSQLMTKISEMVNETEKTS